MPRTKTSLGTIVVDMGSRGDIDLRLKPNGMELYSPDKKALRPDPVSRIHCIPILMLLVFFILWVGSSGISFYLCAYFFIYFVLTRVVANSRRGQEVFSFLCCFQETKSKWLIGCCNSLRLGSYHFVELCSCIRKNRIQLCYDPKGSLNRWLRLEVLFELHPCRELVTTSELNRVSCF